MKAWLRHPPIMIRVLFGLVVLLAALGASLRAAAGELSVIPLVDGERTGPLGDPQFLNNWGGPFNPGNIPGVSRDFSIARSGSASVRADLGTIPPSGFGFFQTFSSQPADQNTRQTRDLTRYSSFEGYVRNDTGSTLNLKYEIKDYRDDGGHQAFHNFTVPAAAGWTKIKAPLDLTAPGWNVVGTPDLSRTYVTSFVVTPQAGAASGSIYLDDFTLREPGPAIDVQSALIATLVDRLAERQFMGLWTARHRTTGLIYNSSDNAQLAAMNTTGGVLWMLPAAVRRGWVSQTEADAHVAQIVASLNVNLNQTTYLPSRFISPVTAGLPGAPNEESSIDSAFMALALHHYKSQPAMPAGVAMAIDAVQNRFAFDAFATAEGFRLAYFPGGGFTAGAYDGYTNEGKVISLAAELSDDHHVPLESRWNSDVHRARVFLVNPDDAHLTHSFTQFRAPFEQALLNLFVDTSDRGVDNYPDRALATNPWLNYVRYEREVSEKLDQLDRDLLFQPDAGYGGSSGYEQYSLYNDFGQPELFMPWSVSLALLAGAPRAEESLRLLLDNDLLSGPLGLADSARWATEADGPTDVPASQDNWNVVLSTMALLEYLEGGNSASHFFAALPEVNTALDAVFVEGDVDGNGLTDGADLLIWRAGFGSATGATPAVGDADGDGTVDGADLLRWQRGVSDSGAAATAGRVPEPATLHQLAAATALLLCSRFGRRRTRGDK